MYFFYKGFNNHSGQYRIWQRHHSSAVGHQGYCMGLLDWATSRMKGLVWLMSERVWGDEAERRDGGEGTRESRTKK